MNSDTDRERVEGQRQLADALRPTQKRTLPKNISVKLSGYTYSLTIDGDEFPWMIAQDGIQIGNPGPRMPTVTLTLLAESVDVDHSLHAKPSEEQK